MVVNKVDTFEEFKNTVNDKEGKKYVFVDFYADWCGPCKAFAPKLEEFSETYGKNITFIKVNIEEIEEEMVEKYSISSLPTFMVFENGSLESLHQPIVGANAKKVEDKLKSLNEESLSISDDF